MRVSKRGAGVMSARVIDNSFLSTSAQSPKLIALILNYTLPTQVYKLLQKGLNNYAFNALAGLSSTLQ